MRQRIYITIPVTVDFDSGDKGVGIQAVKVCPFGIDISNSLTFGQMDAIEKELVKEQQASTPNRIVIEKWLIWSIEHGAWWMPNSTGYTKNRNGAGRYTLDEAISIVCRGNWGSGNKPNEAMIQDLQ